MAQAFRCDGCGEFYEGRRTGSVEHVPDDSDYGETTHELCADCHRSVVAALDNESVATFADIGGGE